MIPEIAIHKRPICKHRSDKLWLDLLPDGALDNVSIIYQQVPQISVISRLPNLITLSAGTHNGYILWNAFRPKTSRNNMVAGYFTDSTAICAYTLFDFSGGLRPHLPSSPLQKN